jgi:hypothetical protein
MELEEGIQNEPADYRGHCSWMREARCKSGGKAQLLPCRAFSSRAGICRILSFQVRK